jgi:hypothetical protein
MDIWPAADERARQMTRCSVCIFLHRPTRPVGSICGLDLVLNTHSPRIVRDPSLSTHKPGACNGFADPINEYTQLNEVGVCVFPCPCPSLCSANTHKRTDCLNPGILFLRASLCLCWKRASVFIFQGSGGCSIHSTAGLSDSNPPARLLVVTCHSCEHLPSKGRVQP